MLRQTQGGLGLRTNNVHHGFGLDQIDPAIQKSATRELTWIRQTGSIFKTERKNPINNQHSAMTVDLEDILAGIGPGCPHEHCHRLIHDISANGIDNSTKIKTVAGKATVADRFENGIGDICSLLTAHTDNSDAAVTRRRAHRCYRIVYIHALLQLATGISPSPTC